MKKRSNIKKLTTGIVLGAAALGATYTAFIPSNQSESIPPTHLVQEKDPTNLIYTSDLEGIADIKEYPVAGSKYTLVNVRQIHPSQVISTSANGRFIRYGLQTNLLESLESLHSQKPFEAFFPEGVRMEEVHRYNAGLELLSNSLHTKNKYTISVLNAIMKPFDEVEGAFLQSPAATTFSLIHNIPWSATGNAKINTRSGKELEKNPRSTSRVVYDDREDFVITRIAEDFPNGAYALTVFGANHDFRNNIEEWNAKNPQKAFSLIVVTPTLVSEDDQKMLIQNNLKGGLNR